MADNEQRRDHLPADPAAPPPAVRPPAEITPEQIRQFQEFQRFQQLMRESAEQGTPPPQGMLPPWSQPPPKQSLPRRLLKAAVGKIITGLVVLAILVLAGYLAINYFFGEDHDQLPASQTGGGKATTNLIFETSPKNAVSKVYDDIAQGDTKSACSRFTDEARAEFTKNMSEYGNTCAQIVTTIHNSVAANHMKSEYANPWIPGSAVPQATGDSVSVSSCAMTVTGGPRLGLMTLSKIPHSEQAGGDPQWIVSGHQAEPQDCGGTVSSPPTT